MHLQKVSTYDENTDGVLEVCKTCFFFSNVFRNCVKNLRESTKYLLLLSDWLIGCIYCIYYEQLHFANSIFKLLPTMIDN